MLLGQNILRRNGNNIEIWASKHDLKSEEMNILISRAEAFKMLAERGEFALMLPGAEGRSAMNLDGSMTIRDLQGIASASTGISRSKLIMTHLNTELVCGTLGSNGVLPGSCIIVSELRE